MGTIRTLAPPARFSTTPLQLRLPAPAVGEHTAAVLGELGMAPSDLDHLIRSGIVYDATRADAAPQEVGS